MLDRIYIDREMVGILVVAMHIWGMSQHFRPFSPSEQVIKHEAIHQAPKVQHSSTPKTKKSEPEVSIPVQTIEEEIVLYDEFDLLD